MKKLALLLSLLPLMAGASSDFDIPGRPLTDSELSEVYSGDEAPARCALRSDMYCYGKPVGALCILDPQPPFGRSGLCRARSRVDQYNRVTCYCR